MYEASHFNYADLFVVVAMVRICDSFFSSVPSFCYSHCERVCVCVYVCEESSRDSRVTFSEVNQLPQGGAA